MNYTEQINKALNVQKITLETRNVPFNIFLKDNGDILRLCFLEDEDDEAIIVSETTQYGTEEIRIIPKDNISYIAIFYDFSSLEPLKQDKMII